MKKWKGLIQDALLCKSSNTVRSLLKCSSTSSLDRASLEWVERAYRMQPETSYSLLDQTARPSKPLFWSSEVSDTSRMLFLTLQVLALVEKTYLLLIICYGFCTFAAINRKKNWKTKQLIAAVFWLDRSKYSAPTLIAAVCLWTAANNLYTITLSAAVCLLTAANKHSKDHEPH